MWRVGVYSSSRGSGVRRAQAEASLARTARNWASRSMGMGWGCDPVIDGCSCGWVVVEVVVEEERSNGVWISPAGTSGIWVMSKVYLSSGRLVRAERITTETAATEHFSSWASTAAQASVTQEQTLGCLDCLTGWLKWRTGRKVGCGYTARRYRIWWMLTARNEAIADVKAA
ncbi:hypothetical protein ACKS0A_04264 [Histoplasma ohiense]